MSDIASHEDVTHTTGQTETHADTPADVQGAASDDKAPPCIDIACLTIAECTPVADQIRQALADAPKVFIRLSNCEELDTAGAQLLTILKCDEGVAGRLVFDAPSDTAKDVFSLLGLSSLFEVETNPC